MAKGEIDCPFCEGLGRIDGSICYFCKGWGKFELVYDKEGG